MDFFFSTLNVSPHCFPTCIVSDKISITILFFISLYILFLFFKLLLLFFSSLPPQITFVFLSLVSTDLIMLGLGVIFFIFILLMVYWASWIYEFIVVITFGIMSTIIFSRILYLPPFLLCWDSNFTYIRPPDIGWLVTDAHYFLAFFFLCFILNNSYCYSSSLIFSFVLFNLLLILFKMFFILDTFYF